MNTQKHSNVTLTVTGKEAILKETKISLIQIIKTQPILTQDTVSVFSGVTKINPKALRYKYLVNYKDSLFTSIAFDNVIKAIGKERAKHHWHFFIEGGKLYANFSNKRVDSINTSTFLLKKN